MQAAIDAGEPCARLFAIRNAMAPADPDRDAANERLRGVGCYSAQSTRRTS